MQTLAPTLLEVAREALAEWDADYFSGGELPYPFWADAVIKQYEQAEELTRQIEALGRKECRRS